MSRAIRISPSIAASNLMRLEDVILRLNTSGANAIHIDCMDGHFVPHLTLGIPFIEQMRPLTSLPFDVHIMVSNPANVVMDYIKAGADTVSFHIESVIHAYRTCSVHHIHKVCEMHTRQILAKIKGSGKRAGIVINPPTDLSYITSFLSEVDVINVMTVNPGFSFQTHLTSVHTKISALNDMRTRTGLGFEIQVDGGVNTSNAPTLKGLGVDNFVVGGGIFKQQDYAAAIRELKSV